MLKNGLFITFEGGEGCGKSTQSLRLEETLLAKGMDVVRTREPGGTESAEEIRNLLVIGEPKRWDSHTEALLMFASRSEHWTRKIKPALNEGKIVICDRFADSSYAYQGFGRDLGVEGLKTLYKFAVGSAKPNVTFLLDIDPTIGLLRTRKRNLDIDERFEKESILFHQKVREGYLSLAKQEPERFHILDATSSEDDLQKQIQEIIFSCLT